MPQMSTESLGLYCEGLNAGYGSLTVVHNATIRVRTGEVVGLIGRNGSGKSTLLKGIMGITWAHATRLSLDGQDLLNLPIWRRQAAGLSISLQLSNVFTDMTVGDNLQIAGLSLEALATKFHKSTLRKIAENLVTKSRQLAGTLSGGERRVLGVAMALARTRRILLADEPTLGLSPEAASEMLQYITSLPRSCEDLGVLVISHDYKSLAALCDRLYILRGGQVYRTVERHQHQEWSTVLQEFIDEER